MVNGDAMLLHNEGDSEHPGNIPSKVFETCLTFQLDFGCPQAIDSFPGDRSARRRTIRQYNFFLLCRPKFYD